MAGVNVLSTMAFPDEWLERVRTVSPRLTVTQYTAATAAEVPAALWRETDVLYTGSALPDPSQAPRLRWVQLDTSGVDHVQTTGLWATGVEFTTLNGVAPSNMAEFAVMMMLAFGHRLRLMVELQGRREWPTFQERWDRFMPSELRGATVGIVGYGSIGREIGRLAHALGMRVLAMRRSGTGAGAGAGAGAGLGEGATARETYRIPSLAQTTNPEPDRVFLPAQLAEMLPECDYVVLIVPYTAATRHMIDERALRAMKPSAVLVNLARGGVVDETVLVRALREGWIAGAALDVFEEEPLPADHPLWSMPNVLISPHVAGLTPHYHERVMGVFAANLQRFLDDQPLLNRVDRERGY
ncbi:MAG: D-2-hydroxyacid dehydrogenase [Chloroflexia bacterium]|nr:D-2-hydroxyacid dehydrogenase [Chloroflexia bacterium]